MTQRSILVTRMIPREGIELLEKHARVTVSPQDYPLSREEFLEMAREHDGVIAMLTDRIDSELLDAASGIRAVANFAVGYDNIDLACVTKRGVAVSNTPDVLTDATAEMAWALLFAVSRRVVESDSHMRCGNWHGWGPLQFVGGGVAGATLGIVGAGRIGTAMARKSRGFDMPIVYTDATANQRLETECGARRVSFEDLLAQSDYVSIHCPLTPQTRHLFGRDQLRQMKKSAYLINTARGPIVDESALVEALTQGWIAGAGLDVYEREPLMAAGLAECRNAVLTPHTASATFTSRAGMAIKAARNLEAMLDGHAGPDCLNPEVFTQKVRQTVPA